MKLKSKPGSRFINALGRNLTIPESTQKAANNVFKLAVGLNFIQGRRTRTVAAVCLYIACRRQTGNTIMLIDFADNLMVSFNLYDFAPVKRILTTFFPLVSSMFSSLVVPIRPC